MRKGQAIYLSGCAAGTATVELRFLKAGQFGSGVRFEGMRDFQPAVAAGEHRLQIDGR